LLDKGEAAVAPTLKVVEVLSEGRAAVFEEPSGPSGVRLRDRPRTAPHNPRASVAIRRAALNHLDLWLAHGAQRVEPPRVICADGAGVVEERVDGRWKQGDEVVIYPVACCWECAPCRAGQNLFCERFHSPGGCDIVGEDTDGTACELFQIDHRNLYPKPRSLSWEEAAAFPLTFLTAWRMLVTRARLQRGETLLVVGAGAGVAAAAIQIGKHLGARVLATSRSEGKRKRAQELGADATFESEGFGKPVRQATAGKGVDVVFEHVGPATMGESLRALRKGGRVVFCGSTSGTSVELPMFRLFFGQVDFLGSTMGNSGEFEQVLNAIDEGLRPVVDSVYPLEDVQKALEHLDGAEQFGKVVLRVSD
jgi:NADPH:quinone reductase-like Zn-dependent oxidoreductase